MFYTFVLKRVEMILKSNEKEDPGNLQIEITCQTSQAFVFMICKKMRIVKIYRISQASFLN